MALAALGLYVVWFALAFGLRSALQRRRTGDAGFRWPPGQPGSLEWLAGICFASALATGVAAPLAEMTGMRALSPINIPLVRWSGLVLACVGILLTFIAQLSMGDSWRIGVDETERTSLVTKGVFAVVRNPIFTAMFATAAGLAAMVPNVVSVVGLAGLVTALQVQVRLVEEKYLLAVHGAEYVQYAQRVGRFVPQIGRLRPRRV